MKTSRFSDSRIIAALKQAEAGKPVPELCREHGISSATFYKWRAKFGGMDASLMARLKELEAENARFKKMYAEERLKAEIVNEALEKKVVSHLAGARWLTKPCSSAARAYAWRVRHSGSARPAIATRRSARPRMPRSPIT